MKPKRVRDENSRIILKTPPEKGQEILNKLRQVLSKGTP